jgi:transposase-like protein
MTVVSVADVCRRLGIDAKTLRRWLADAQLSLHSHPHDGRKKGLSGEDLQMLARLHLRSLAPFPQEPPASGADELPTLGAPLLERLDALQAQLAALQQQVAALTTLLQQPLPQPSSPLAPTPHPTVVRRPPKPASPASHAHPTASATAKTPRKPVHVLPRVEYGRQGRYVVICPKHGVLTLEPDTPEWFAWLAQQSSFRFVGKVGRFTAHHEWRVPRGAWRAHRHIRNRSYTLRLAPTQELTMAVLEQAAATLQAHLR